MSDETNDKKPEGVAPGTEIPEPATPLAKRPRRAAGRAAGLANPDAVSASAIIAATTTVVSSDGTSVPPVDGTRTLIAAAAPGPDTGAVQDPAATAPPDMQEAVGKDGPAKTLTPKLAAAKPEPAKAGPAKAEPAKAGPAKPDDDEDEDDDDDDEDDGPDLEHATFDPTVAAGAFSNFFRFLGPYLHKYRAGFSLVIGGVLVETAFNVAFPLSLKFLIDDVLGDDGDRDALIWILSTLGIFGVIVSICSVVYEYYNAKYASMVIRDIRERLFNHAQLLSARFYSKTKAGQVISRFSGDMSTLEDTVMHGVDWGLLPAFELVAGIGLMFYLNWQLALLAMLVFPLTLIGPRFFAPRAVEGTYQLKRKQADTLSVVSENIGAQAVVKAFGLQKISIGWFGQRNEIVQRQMHRVRFLEALTERSITITVLLLHLVVFGIGAVLTYQGQITLGTFVTFESVFWELSYNINHLTNFIPQLIQGAGALKHINELLDEPARGVDTETSVDIPRLKSAIVFENLAFSYDGETRQLDAINLTIPAETRVAIVGESGSGKSTTLAMLLRLYDPEAGRITIDGVNIADVKRDSLRGQMAVVFQDNVLFGTSIRENIRLGKPDATDEEVERAARAAEIHKFILTMPEGYDTVVGERGSTLSGGQRQRMAIARAIVRDPAILLLDEATSALDHATEAAINKTLRKVTKGRTTITVTHRLTSVIDYDQIVVMSDGRIVQTGTHDELVRRKGHYQRLWNKQKHALENPMGDDED